MLNERLFMNQEPVRTNQVIINFWEHLFAVNCVEGRENNEKQVGSPFKMGIQYHSLFVVRRPAHMVRPSSKFVPINSATQLTHSYSGRQNTTFCPKTFCQHCSGHLATAVPLAQGYPSAPSRFRPWFDPTGYHTQINILARQNRQYLKALFVLHFKAFLMGLTLRV